MLRHVRSAETIIPDIHRPSRGGEPRAVVRYAIGDHEQEITWNNEKGVSPFTRMSVFDSRAVALHLEESVTYLYTPADLALFKYSHSAIEGVRVLLEAEATARQPRHNPFLTAFSRGTLIYPKIDGLSASTNVAELEELANISEAERTELEALKVSVDARFGLHDQAVEAERRPAERLRRVGPSVSGRCAGGTRSRSSHIRAPHHARAAQRP